MKRFIQLGLAGALALALVSTAGAQQVPTQVTRLGDWVEIANDVFMNIIALTDWRYAVNKNTDFEGKIRDRVASRQNLSTTPHNGTGDLLYEQTRLGVDMRYRKNLTMQVLFEQRETVDGNRIDNGINVFGDPGVTQTFEDGRNLACAGTSNCDQRNTVNLERAWINYKFPDTPLSFEIGASLWTTDPAGVIGDDDPRFAVFLDFGALKLSAAAVLQTTSQRLGLTNDNDDIYYNFGVEFAAKPFTVGLDVSYFRFRFSGAGNQTTAGQKHDTVLIRPSITGNLGLVSFLAQPMVIWGKAKGTNAGGNRDFDVFAYGFIGQVEANLGVVRPFIAVVFGSGDGNPQNDKLKGFAPLPQNEITLTTGSRYFDVFDIAPSWGGRDVFPPALIDLGTGFEFMHTVGDPWNDRIHPVADIDTTYANPGVLLLAPGVKVFPLKGHELDLYYIYRRVMKSEPLEAVSGLASVSKTMTHEVGMLYQWAPSPYFDFRLMGAIVIPDNGVKDLAAVQDCDFTTPGVQPCQGKDLALFGQVRFRARF